MRPKSTMVKTSLVGGALLLGLLYFSSQSPYFPLIKMTYNKPPSVTVFDNSNSSTTMQQLPKIIIIGVRKCGTRALLEMLNMHSAVVRIGREVHFFDNDENFKRGLSWYRSIMPFTYSNQLTAEKTPSYFPTSHVPKRIYDLKLDVKMLLILKDPIHRVLSDYTQSATTRPMRNLPPLPPFESLVMRDGEINEKYTPIQVSLYYEHMQNWLKYFPLESIYIVDGDEFVKNPIPVLKEVEKFLGLPPELDSTYFYYNATKGFFCMKVNGEEECMNDSKGRDYPEVDPAVMQKIRHFFHEPNQKFFELVGRTFNWE